MKKLADLADMCPTMQFGHTFPKCMSSKKIQFKVKKAYDCYYGQKRKASLVRKNNSSSYWEKAWEIYVWFSVTFLCWSLKILDFAEYIPN